MSFGNELSSWRHISCGRRKGDDFGANVGVVRIHNTKAAVNVKLKTIARRRQLINSWPKHVIFILSSFSFCYSFFYFFLKFSCPYYFFQYFLFVRFIKICNVCSSTCTSEGKPENNFLSF